MPLPSAAVLVHDEYWRKTTKMPKSAQVTTTRRGFTARRLQLATTRVGLTICVCPLRACWPAAWAGNAPAARATEAADATSSTTSLFIVPTPYSPVDQGRPDEPRQPATIARPEHFSLPTWLIRRQTRSPRALLAVDRPGRGSSSVGQRGVGDHPAPQRTSGQPGSVPQLAVPRGIGDLVGHVQQLLHPAHEVPRGQIRLVEHLTERGALGPAVRRPG